MYISLGIPYSVVCKYPARGKKIPSLNRLWRHGCNSEWLGFLLPTNDKVKKNDRRQCQPLFGIDRVNFNGEKKTTEWFIGSNLQCCLHVTVLLTVKYSAELNKYILLVRVVCEKNTGFGDRKNLPVYAFNKIADITDISLLSFVRGRYSRYKCIVATKL